MTKKHLEDKLHKQINQYLTIVQRQCKIDLFTYNASGELRTKTTGALLKAKGLLRGLPDYTIKRLGNDGIMYNLSLEAKCGTNKQTKEQKDYETFVTTSKNEVYKVVRNIEDTVKATEEFLRVVP
jgi:hypothetical protein